MHDLLDAFVAAWRLTLSGDSTLVGSVLLSLLAGQASPLIVAIGGHHHHRQIGSPRLDLAQQLQPVDHGHVYVRQSMDASRRKVILLEPAVRDA